jgi:hypothetical protein
LLDSKDEDSTVLRNKWNYTSIPAVCLHGKQRDNFTFTFAVM